jgi:uncharacterized membrane protein YfcA
VTFGFDTLGLVLAIYFVAGTVKGTVGLGLPTVTLSLLVPTLGLTPAIALTLVPTLVTNVWQALVGGRARAILKRLWPLFVLAVPGTWMGTFVLARADADVLAGLLGIALSLYALYGLVAPPLPRPGRLEPILSPIVGLTGGLMAGMVGAFLMPGIIYLQALRLERDELIQTLGLVFLTLTLALGAGLTRNDLLTGELLLVSCLAVLPALVGMELGRRIRRRLSEQRFRRIFFVAILALGANMVVRAAL